MCYNYLIPLKMHAVDHKSCFSIIKLKEFLSSLIQLQSIKKRLSKFVLNVQNVRKDLFQFTEECKGFQ